MASQRCWIIIPCQALDRGKTRLGTLLGPAERRRLAGRWLRHVVRAARDTSGARRTMVVSGSGEVLGLARRLGVRARAERASELNGALGDACAFARRRGARAIAVLHADLPQLSRLDIVRLLQALARHPGMALAPDQDDIGTNALAMRPPGRFEFRFGRDSFAEHRAAARGCRIRVRVLRSAGLAGDVDTPQQYAALEKILAAGRFATQ